VGDLQYDDVWAGSHPGRLAHRARGGSHGSGADIDLRPDACCSVRLVDRLLDLPFWLLSVIICGAGVGIGGCPAGLNSLSGRIYPRAIRSTGAGWALGAGRVGTIVGPLLGGVLLTLGWRTQAIFVVLAIPIFSVTLLMGILGRVRRGW
jgi:MFS transporter, AAHS family, 4-hydroxybenzoate transporter